MFKADQQQIYVASKSISIKPDVVSDVLESDQIRINIPSYVNFIDPNQTYIKFKLKMSNQRGILVPDVNCGGHALFRTVRYRDGNNQTSLEVNDDYNANYAMLSNYNAQQTIRHKRELFEGFMTSEGDDLSQASLYYGARAIQGGATATAPDTTPRTKLAPTLQFQLNSGLFKQGKIIPVSAMNGLRILIDTEDSSRALQYLSDFGDKSVSNLNASTRIVTTGPKAVGNDARDGSQAKQIYHIATNLKNEFNPFDVDDLLYISDNDTANTNEELLGVIHGFSLSGGLIVITYVVNRTLASGLSNIHPIGSHLYYKFADRASPHSVFGLTDTGNNKTKTIPVPTYSLSDVEMVVQSVQPPEAYQNGILKASQSGSGIQFDILNYELSRYNQVNTSGLMQCQIPTQARRAMALFSQPLISANNRNLAVSSFVGVPDEARNYEYIHGTKHFPSRLAPLARYNTAVAENLTSRNAPISFRNEALHTSELQKAIVNIGERVHSLQKIATHFAIARSLSKYGGTMDLEGDTLSLRVDYGTGVHNKLFNNYVYCLRRIMIKNGIVEASNQIPSGV